MDNTSGPTPRFRRWVRKFGTRTLSRHLGIHRSNIYYWMDNRYLPKASHARTIVALSRGALSYDDIYGRPTRADRPLERSQQNVSGQAQSVSVSASA